MSFTRRIASWLRATGLRPALLLVLLGLVVPSALAPVVKAAPAPVLGSVLVKVNPGYSLTTLAQVLTSRGYTVKRTYTSARVLVVQTRGRGRDHVNTVWNLGRYLGICSVELNVGVRQACPPAIGSFQSQAVVFGDELFNASMTGQAAMQLTGTCPPPRSTYCRGGYPLVAVLDGGFSLSHEALPLSCVSSTYDACDNDASITNVMTGGGDRDTEEALSPGPGAGHGTAVAALIRAAAPNARFVLVRIVDDTGVGSLSTLAAGLDAALARNPRMIVIPAGGSTSSYTVESLLYTARCRGILVVCAAGNGGGAVQFPARSSYAWCVGGCTLACTRDSGSCGGPSVDVGSPSLNVIAPYPGTSRGYGRWCGTSFSAALAAGAVAQTMSVDYYRGTDVGTWLQCYSCPWRDGCRDMGRGIVSLNGLKWW